MRSRFLIWILAAAVLGALALLRSVSTELRTSSAAQPSETWKYPVNTWVVLDRSSYASSSIPGFRGWHQASYDLEFRDVVLFGGSGSTYMSDTWTYNLERNSWRVVRRHPDLEGPCRRDMHNLVYDPVGKLHWLFNGISYSNLQPGCDGVGTRAGVWSYDRAGNSWTKVSNANGVHHRLAPGIAYNSDDRSFLEFGGSEVNSTNTTYRFHIETRTWIKLRPSKAPPPRINIEGGLVYDKANKVFVLFGGLGTRGQLGDTWIFDPRTGTWTEKTPEVSPGVRDLHAMAYDEQNQVVVLFGGREKRGKQSTKLSDTWVYDSRKNTWTELKGLGSPPAIAHASAVYDSFYRVIIVVSGETTLLLRYEPSTRSSNSTLRPRTETTSTTGLLKPARAEASESAQQQAASVVETSRNRSSLDIPLRTWIARRLPGPGKGPWSGKHMRMAHNPVNGRIYFLGGDYGGPIGMDSGRNEVYSYSIANNDWRQEHPYCGPPGTVQPSHPDEVGWVYDTRRNIFWMVPGYMGGDQKVCPNSTLIRGEIMTFDPVTKKWDLPGRKRPDGIAGNKKFAQYDPATDTIIRLAWTGFSESEVYDIKTDTWSKRKHGNRPYQIGQEHTAIDLDKRFIYVIGPKEGRLYRYDIDARNFSEIQDLPAKGRYNNTWPVWDSVNRVLLWPHMDRSYITLYAYHPEKGNWETLPMTQPDGLVARGLHAYFDPYQNVLLVMGGVEKPNPHLFLYRYGNGGR